MVRFDFLKLNPRLGRVRYLTLFFFWNAIIAIALIGILLSNPEGKLPDIIIAGGILLLLIAMINMIFLQVRRLHDLNLNGWWLLLMLIPVINFAMGLFLLFVPGSPQQNRFGPPAPKPERSDYILLVCSIVALFGAMYFYKDVITTLIEQKKVEITLR